MKSWLLLAAFFALQAHADSVQVSGTPECPVGMTLIRFGIGERTVASVCMAAAELERATYSKGPQGGEVACRVVIVRAK